MKNKKNIDLTVFEKGSAWLGTDFHLHTQSDSEFKYNEDQSWFTSKYIEALNKTGIKIGVITNHNKFNLDEFKELHKNALKEEIWLLPGIELSLKDGSKGIHALIVFDQSWIESKDFINSFLDQAFTGQANYDKPPYPNCKFDLQEACNKLDEFNKDYFVILAHVDAPNGFFNELSGRNLEAFVKTEVFRKKVLALQKATSRDNLSKLKGIIGEENIPALVDGSDPKNLDQIGNQGSSCYTKIGDFNFEALMYALKNYHERVTGKKPDLHHSHIESITYEGGLLDGVHLNLSAHLNTLIGIRGSGKSSIVETLRYALNIPVGARPADDNYKSELVRYVLGSGGKVIVHLRDKHQKEYRVERIYNQRAEVFDDDRLLTNITADAFLHKPLHFGQKDLSNRREGFEEELVNKLLGNKLNDVRERIILKHRQIETTVRELNQLSELKDKKEQFESDKANKSAQLKIFQEHGLEKKLDKQVQFNKDSTVLKEVRVYLRDAISELTEARKQFEQGIHQWDEYKSQYNSDLIQKLLKNLVNIKGKLNVIEKTETEIINEIESITAINEEFESRSNGLKEEFAKIQREASMPNLRAEDFVNLKKSLNLIELRLKELEKSLKKQKKLQDSLIKELSELNKLYHEEYSIINKEVEAINEHQTSLKVVVNFKRNRAAFKNFIDEYVKGSGLYKRDIESLVENFQDGIEIFLNLDDVKNKLSEAKFYAFKKVIDQNLSELLTYQVPNEFVIKYHGKELKDHSLGQRASALILFILSQKEHDVIIIDQPEDDLDNQTIYQEVIKTIQKVKPETQFIFATHNPNIPVLGDAEQVQAFEFTGSEIRSYSGSIDKKTMQDRIINIMEGGREAFKKRKEIYDLWTH